MFRRSTSDPLSTERRQFVAEFVRRIHDEPFQPRYRGRPVGPPVVGWSDRLRSYFWPKPEVDLSATERLMEPWFERAGVVSERLVEHSAWSDLERTEAAEVAWTMLEWGRTTRQSDFSRSTVEVVFRRALGLPVATDPPKNSGWSKVAALATAYLEGHPNRAPHVIWDSRVSASIVFRLDEMLSRAERPAAMRLEPKRMFPRIGPVTGRGGSRKPGGARHRTRLRLRWAYAYGRWSSQDAGSELVREIRDELNGGGHPAMPTPSGGRVPWTIRGVESVLFMDGY